MTDQEALDVVKNQISDLNEKKRSLEEKIKKDMMPGLKTISHKFFFDTDSFILYATKDIDNKQNFVNCISIYEDVDWNSSTLVKTLHIDREGFDIEDASYECVKDIPQKEFEEKLDSLIDKYRNEILA